MTPEKIVLYWGHVDAKDSSSSRLKVCVVPFEPQKERAKVAKGEVYLGVID